MKNNMMNSIVSAASRIGFKAKKCSPEIMVVVGAVGIVASFISVARASTKLSQVLEESKKTMDEIHERYDDEEFVEKHELTETDRKHDVTITAFHTGLKLAKLYGPSIALGAVSLACLIGSNHILRKRNAALAAAYATVGKAFEEYRGHVVEHFGEDIDRELRYNIRKKEIEETVTDENGETKTVRNVVEIVSDPLGSPYAKYYDCTCLGYDDDNPENNMIFLKQQERFANDKLQLHGHLFLNEVYDMLGIPRTEAGQSVGWIYDEKNPIGDNYVDFGIFQSNRANRRFVNGYESVALLDFNVDGNIMNRLFPKATSKVAALA